MIRSWTIKCISTSVGGLLTNTAFTTAAPNALQGYNGYIRHFIRIERRVTTGGNVKELKKNYVIRIVANRGV